MREKIADRIVDALDGYGYLNTRQARDEIFFLIREEIEKVENPLEASRFALNPEDQHYCGFEDCRQKILNLLKERVLETILREVKN